MTRPRRITTAEHIFPRAALRALREHVIAKGGCLADVSDEVLVSLLTTTFWAGLETYEGEHHPIGIVFLGTSDADFVLPEGGEPTSAPMYQWKVLRFDEPRPFVAGELVKLAVAAAGRHLYTAVELRPADELVIVGLIREGVNVGPDPFLTITTLRPGSMSMLSGDDFLLEYERGVVLTAGEGVWFATGPLRRALEAMARAAGLGDEDLPGYVRAVRSVVADMIAHGRGGILVVSDEERPDVVSTAAYRMKPDSSVTSLLRLARRICRSDSAGRVLNDMAFPGVLRNAFLSEAERVTEELGALTAIDGAVVVNRELALLAFGVALPLAHDQALAEASDPEGLRFSPFDLGSRGTRHRAGATFAAAHPGSVVVVASSDGQVSCMHRQAGEERTLVWRLGPAAGDTDT